MICSSPLKRAYATAAIIADVIDVPIVTQDELRECCFGPREGERSGAWYEDWRLGRATPEGAESLSDFLARAVSGVNAALGLPGPVLIVAHGGVYWAVERATHLVEPSQPPERHQAIPHAVPVWHEPPSAAGEVWRTMLPGA